MWRIFCGLSLATVTLVAGQPDSGGKLATSLSVAEPAFRNPQVTVATSMPPQFDLVLERDMPTPGWSFVLDDVAVDRERGRITARITEIGPEGVVSQVVTETACRVPLGKLERGSYWLELWLRRGIDQSHVRAQALVLHAR